MNARDLPPERPTAALAATLFSLVSPTAGSLRSSPSFGTATGSWQAAQVISPPALAAETSLIAAQWGHVSLYIVEPEPIVKNVAKKTPRRGKTLTNVHKLDAAWVDPRRRQTTIEVC